MELVKWLALALAFLLGPVILIHELGHFLTARRAGVHVIEFGLGFPPRLLTLAQGSGWLEVEGRRLLMPGRLRLPEGLQVGQQVEVLARPDPEGRYRVLRIVPSDAPSGQEERAQEWVIRGQLTALSPGTRYTLNLLPMGGFVRMLGEEDPSDPRSLAAQPKRWRLATLLSGPLANLLAAFVLLTAAYMAGVPQRYFVQINEVVPDSAAEAAGLQVGDVLISVDGEPLDGGPGQLREHILASPGQALTLGVVRGEERLTLVATPRLQDGHGFLGIAMQSLPDSTSLVYYSLPQATVSAGNRLVEVFASILRLPRQVAQGQVQPSEVRPTGMPGILQWLALALKQGLEWHIAFYALETTAMISLALGLTNLLPLPALDGGRALFVAIELARGRRLNPAAEGMIHMAGMAILLALSIFIIIQDIVNPVIPWSMLSR